jgi:hypothetical protein
MKHVKLLLISCYCVVSCHPSNTSDPQTSKGMTESKDLGVFVQEYTVDNNAKRFTIEAAWIENRWKNSRSGFFSTKTEKFPDFQLVLPYSHVENEGGFLNEWEIDEEKLGVLARNGSTFFLDLNNGNFPDTFHFKIVKLKDRDPVEVLGTFTVTKTLVAGER